MTPITRAARLYALLVELQSTTVHVLHARLLTDEADVTLTQVRRQLCRMVERGQAVRLTEHRPIIGAPMLYGPGRQARLQRPVRTPEERQQAKRERDRRQQQARTARARAQRAVKPAKRRPEPQQPKVRDRPAYQAREVATAPPKQTFPSTDAWLAANANKVEVLPPGQVSKASRLRFDHRRVA